MNGTTGTPAARARSKSAGESPTVSAEIGDGRLAAFDVRGLPVVRQWFVVKRREKRLLPAALALWGFLSSRGAEFLPELPGRRRRHSRAASG